MTAIEWFDEQIQEHVIAQDTVARKLVIEISFEEYMDLKRQTKEMEKEQIIKAVRAGYQFYEDGFVPWIGEQYYNETYKK